MWHRVAKGGKKTWGKRGAGILYTDGDSILLLKRNDPSDHDKTWSLPGGKQEEGESDIDTARRESEEECGVPVTGQRFAHYSHQDGGFRWTTYLYKVKKQFSCKLSKEHTDYKWFSLDSLDRPSITLHPALKKNISTYINRINRSGFREWLEK